MTITFDTNYIIFTSASDKVTQIARDGVKFRRSGDVVTAYQIAPIRPLSTAQFTSTFDVESTQAIIATDYNDVTSPVFASGSALETYLKGLIINKSEENAINVDNYGAVGDGVTDDSAAIQAAINTGFPVIFSAKTYLVNTQINLPSNAVLDGIGKATLKTTSNISILSISVNLSNARISNLRFEGDRTTTLRTSQNGISIVGNLTTIFPVSNHITNCVFSNFGNAGIYAHRAGSSTLFSSSGFQGSIYAVNCYAEGCTYGYFLDERAEYTLFTNCTSTRATTANIRVVGGNNGFVGCNFNAGPIGVQLATGTNDGHGVFSGCKINHNTNNVSSTGIVRGMLFDGCMMYAGNLSVSTSTDIKFNACDININSLITLTNNTRLKFINCRWDNTPVFSVTGERPYIKNTGEFYTKTSDYTLLYKDANGTFVNEGAVGNVNFTLPSGFEGLEFYFHVTTAQNMTIIAPSGSTIRIAANVSSVAGNISSNTIGNFIKLKALSTTTWVAESVQGTWIIA